MRPEFVLNSILISVVLSWGCGKGSPSAPTSTPGQTSTQTRIIRLIGNLNFGNAGIGQQPPDGVITVSNDGNANLNVAGINGPCAGTGLTAIGSTTFAVAPNSTVNVVIRFRPTALQNCTGTITVNSDATGGTNTIQVIASGTLDGVPIFSQSGTGDNVFTIPSYVTRLSVVGNYNGWCQNFIAHANGSSLINVIIGTCSVADTRSPFRGTYTVPAAARIDIVSSTGVGWTFAEVR
jgi:hypothetical protein